jgi:hypothetical protein
MAQTVRQTGNAAYKAGQLQDALRHYSAAARVDPSDPLLHNNISLVRLKLGRMNEVGWQLPAMGFQRPLLLLKLYTRRNKICAAHAWSCFSSHAFTFSAIC